MIKNISLILAISLAAYLAYYLTDPRQQLSPSEAYTAVVSTDGKIISGQNQDFLISLFRENDGKRVFESKAKLEMALVMTLKDSTKKEAKINLLCSIPGKYTCSYKFPENLDESKDVDLSLFIGRFAYKPILNAKLTVGREVAIVVQPPNSQAYAGRSLSFNLASIDKKSGLSCSKIPVRVKMTTPSGYTSINRVVLTDTKGLATFKTHIHSASPEGFYTFTFQSGTFEQKISTYIKNSQKAGESLESPESIPVYMPERETNENCGFIFNLNCESDNALMAYGCPDSDHRQIEIWQNGKLHYFANLDMEGGTVSILLRKPLLAGCPALFKVWQIEGDNVTSHEKIRYIPPLNRNEFNSFLMELNSEFRNTDKDKLSLSLSRKAFLGVSPKLLANNLTQIYSQNLKSVYPAPQNEMPLSYYEDILYNEKEKNTNDTGFYLIENELLLSANKDYKIWLDSKSFLEGYLIFLSAKETSLDYLLQEAICRVNLFKYSNLQGKNKEIEKLEGLLIPLSEIYAYLKGFPEKKKQYAPQILSLVNQVRSIVFIPSEFLFDISKGAYSLDNRPMLEIWPTYRSLESIQGLLRQTGEVQLIKDKEKTKIELNQTVMQIKGQAALLRNLRQLPLIISSF